MNSDRDYLMIFILFTLIVLIGLMAWIFRLSGVKCHDKVAHKKLNAIYRECLGAEPK